MSSSYALGTDDDAQFYSENHNDYAGFSVAGAGDVNDDGYDETKRWKDKIDTQSSLDIVLGRGKRSQNKKHASEEDDFVG